MGMGWEQILVGNVHTVEGKFGRIVYTESVLSLFFFLIFGAGCLSFQCSQGISTCENQRYS